MPRALCEKSGSAIYISHLDLMRTLQRAFRRAGLDLRHSEGFNPHPVMSILMPLSLGQSSVCELMDFELMEAEAPAAVVDRLNAVLPEGIRAKEVFDAVRKVKEIKWLRVEGRFAYDERDAAIMVPALEAFFARKEIVIRKKTKRGEGDSDIVPAIDSVSFRAQDGAVYLEAVISAQEPTLNPEHLAGALSQLAPELAPDHAHFRRLEVYDKEMKIFR